MSLPIAGRCFLAEAAHKFSFMDWWLPPSYSAHGGQIDYLFYWIFGITAAALVIVQAVLVWFLIKYRRHPGNTKSHFIHGNTKLEMAWTLTPAVILAVLALASKVAWHNYRYNPDPDKVQVMVVGEQFKWNVIYPGPDNRVGTYMRFPHVSDPKFRTRDSKSARKAVNDYMQFENPLGKAETPKPEGASGSWVDPGEDDDTESALGKPLIIPEHRTVDILLSSKDVLHDFAIPNFRAMLDAVPGMIGHIYFKPQRRSTEAVAVDQIPLSKPLWIDRDTPAAVGDRDGDFSPTRDRAFKLFDPGSDERLGKIINDTFAEIAARDDKALAEKLKAANITAESVLRRLGEAPLNEARAKGIKPLLDAEAARLATDAADVKPLKDAGLEEVIAAAAGKVGSIQSRDTLRTLVESRLGAGATAEQLEAEGKKLAADFKRAGVNHLTTITPFEVVCRELCGAGHATMRAELIVVSDREYDNFIYRNAPPEKRTGRRFHDPSKGGPQIAGTPSRVLAQSDAAPSGSR